MSYLADPSTTHLIAVVLQNTVPPTQPKNPMGSFLLLAVLVVALAWAAFYVARKLLRHGREEQTRPVTPAPSTENSSAFMAASMQAVIQKLRDQEKELERLHKLEKERAAQTEKFSEEVTRNMPAGLLLVNAAGIITSANPAAEQVLEMRGLGFRRYSEALGPNSDLTKLLGACLTKGVVFRREQVEHTASKGEAHLLGVTIWPARKGADQITGAICLLSDLTELASLQQQVQLKENLAALGEISAGIAHEFKNALATISGYAQMIRTEKGDGEVAEYAGLILEQTQNITQVVGEFLKYAKPLDITQDQVSHETVVERVVAELKEALPAVQIAVQGRFRAVAGEEGFLRQALLNLARNAAEAAASAADGPQILIHGSYALIGSSEVQQISVADNGPGIPPAALNKIFRPFFTTKARGTGLGLAVVQKIIVQHGGSVEARNRPQGGAEFIVTLPVFKAAPEAIELSRSRI
ncbi:MAG TPA: ATP-binding protein [Methylomirabilota bacterium]|nr:ATP-binding protein [Methylomirabilota bacterium]